MAYDLVVEIPNEPGALAAVAGAISDAGVNLAAATCMGTADHVDLHILVPHAEAARHALAISHVAVSHEREVVVVDVEDRRRAFGASPASEPHLPQARVGGDEAERPDRSVDDGARHL